MSPGRGDRADTADRIRQTAVSISAVIAVVGAVFGSGAFGGDAMPEAAGGAFAADATPIAPGGPAFAIWTVIYAGLVAYAIWQWFPKQDAVVTDGTVGLYLGWIVVATAANVAAVLAQAGLRDTVNAPDAWAVAVLAVAGLVGVALALWDRGRFVPSAAICWGLAWVGTARLTGDLVSVPAAIAAIAAAAAVLLVTIIARVLARNRLT